MGIRRTLREQLSKPFSAVSYNGSDDYEVEPTLCLQRWLLKTAERKLC